MAEPRDQLLSTLDDLHAELDRVEEVDPEVEAHLRATLAEIRETLDKRSAEEETSFTERLSDAARHFESTHPTIGGLISSTIDTLSRMGI